MSFKEAIKNVQKGKRGKKSAIANADKTFREAGPAANRKTAKRKNPKLDKVR